MAKAVTAYVKLQCPGGHPPRPAPPRPALRAHGVNIGQFVKQFAEVIRVALDNLNTHTVGALYEPFAPAGLELSVLSRQCLNRRIPDAATLAAEVEAWQDARNEAGVNITRCFKVADARK